MRTADHIKYSFDSFDINEIGKATLFSCMAVDVSAKKIHPDIQKVGDRLRKLIVEHIGIFDITFCGSNFIEAPFPVMVMRHARRLD